MNRHVSGALLLFLGIVLGSTINSYQFTQAQAPASVAISSDDLDVLVGELKGIRSDVKSISKLLHDGSIKTVDIINADKR